MQLHKNTIKVIATKFFTKTNYGVFILSLCVCVCVCVHAWSFMLIQNYKCIGILCKNVSDHMLQYRDRKS